MLFINVAAKCVAPPEFIFKIGKVGSNELGIDNLGWQNVLLVQRRSQYNEWPWKIARQRVCCWTIKALDKVNALAKTRNVMKIRNNMKWQTLHKACKVSPD